MNRLALGTRAGAAQQSPAHARQNIPFIGMENYILMIMDVQPFGGSIGGTIGRCASLQWAQIPEKTDDGRPSGFIPPLISLYREETVILPFPANTYTISVDSSPQGPNNPPGGGWAIHISVARVLYTNLATALGILPLVNPLVSFWSSWSYRDELQGNTWVDNYFALRSRGRSTPSYPCFIIDGEIYGSKPSLANGGLGQIGVRNIVQIQPPDEEYIGFNEMLEIPMPEFEEGILGRVRAAIPIEEFADWQPFVGTLATF